MSDSSAKRDPNRDLQHFLRLAAAQVRYRITKAEASGPYSSQVARLRLLEELIKEQIPHEDPRSSASPTR